MKNNSIIIIILFLMLPWNAFAALNERQKNDYRARAHAATTQSQVEQIITEASKIGNFNPRIDAPFIEELKAIAQGIGAGAPPSGPTPPTGLPEFRYSEVFANFYSLVNAYSKSDLTKQPLTVLESTADAYMELDHEAQSGKYSNTAIPPEFTAFFNAVVNEIHRRPPDFSTNPSFKVVQGNVKNFGKKDLTKLSDSALNTFETDYLHLKQEIQANVQSNKYSNAIIPAEFTAFFNAVQHERQQRGIPPPDLKTSVAFTNAEYYSKINQDLTKVPDGGLNMIDNIYRDLEIAAQSGDYSNVAIPPEVTAYFNAVRHEKQRRGIPLLAPLAPVNLDSFVKSPEFATFTTDLAQFTTKFQDMMTRTAGSAKYAEAARALAEAERALKAIAK